MSEPSATEKNTEIWSTRLQRELLALTTDNATEDAKEEVAGVVPPFVSVQKHELDIAKGVCKVSFLLDLPEAPKSTTPKSSSGEDAAADGTEKTEEVEATPAAKDPVIVALDVSLPKKADGSVDPVAITYPFLKPVAILASGSNCFPNGSTISDGDLIDIEMDWTPSLHLTDAILNISLKCKESVLQGEPFHPAQDGQAEKQADKVEEVMNKAKKISASFGRGLRGLSGSDKSGEGDKSKKGMRLGRSSKKKKEKKSAGNPGEIRIGDEINMLEAPWVDCQGVYSCKAIRRPAFVDETMARAEKAAASAEKSGGGGGSPAKVRALNSSDDGGVPDDFGSYMRLQAGTVSQVCLYLSIFLISVLLSN